MKIKRNFMPWISLDEFADEHNLTLEINERDLSIKAPRFYTQFKYTEVDSGNVVYGDGNTEDEAIEDYCKKISGQIIIIHAGNDDKKQTIKVPLLMPMTLFRKIDNEKKECEKEKLKEEIFSKKERSSFRLLKILFHKE